MQHVRQCLALREDTVNELVSNTQDDQVGAAFDSLIYDRGGRESRLQQRGIYPIPGIARHIVGMILGAADHSLAGANNLRKLGIQRILLWHLDHVNQRQLTGPRSVGNVGGQVDGGKVCSVSIDGN